MLTECCKMLVVRNKRTSMQVIKKLNDAAKDANSKLVLIKE